MILNIILSVVNITAFLGMGRKKREDGDEKEFQILQITDTTAKVLYSISILTASWVLARSNIS